MGLDAPRCCFCEGGEWGKYAHVGCLVKASARTLVSRPNGPTPTPVSDRRLLYEKIRAVKERVAIMEKQYARMVAEGRVW
jgi:hypothetical protein